jgi:hypothetical protein
MDMHPSSVKTSRAQQSAMLIAQFWCASFDGEMGARKK